MSNHADKRSVATDALETLGMKIGPEEKRDAIHLAVEPVIAMEILRPGQHVGLIDGAASSRAPKLLGIVDPFIEGYVNVGERFWLVVYPRQIKSLRHVWEHPDFEPSVDVTPVPQQAELGSHEESVAWMRAWAMEHMSDDYYGDSGTLPADVAYGTALTAGHQNHLGPYENAPITDEWWGHWERITGCKGDRDAHMACSC